MKSRMQNLLLSNVVDFAVTAKFDISELSLLSPEQAAAFWWGIGIVLAANEGRRRDVGE